MGRSQPDILQGTLDLLIMRTLQSGPRHGWDISRRIQQVSDDVLIVQQGSLYPSLHRLERKGLITSSWGASENNRRAKVLRAHEARKAAATRRDEELGGPVGCCWSSPGERVMALATDLLFRLRSLFRRRQQEDHLDDELRFHLEMEAERLESLGHSPKEARRLARLEFGATESIKEQVRHSWGTWRLEHLVKDIEVGVRRLAKRERRFALVATASLALGLGAAGVIFSVVDAVLLQPLPLRNPDRVVSFAETTPEGRRFSTSDANLLDFAERSTTLTHLAAQVVFSDQPALGTGDERIRLEGLRVTSSYFEVLGVSAQMGRVFGPRDVHSVATVSGRAEEDTEVGREAAGAHPHLVGSPHRRDLGSLVEEPVPGGPAHRGSGR